MLKNNVTTYSKNFDRHSTYHVGYTIYQVLDIIKRET